MSKLEIHYGITVTEDTMVAVCRLGLHNLQQIYFNFTPVEAKAILQLYSKFLIVSVINENVLDYAFKW